MKRKILERLLRWKESESRMPLILYGARQTGKTYTLLNFGRTYYKNVAYFNLEDHSDLLRLFERNLPPDRLIQELSALSGQTILKEDTLIFFDEIQASENALFALGAFLGANLGYHIVAAGSVLGIAATRRTRAFPVGKVAMATLYPLDFEEFLWLLGKESLASDIRDAFEAFTPLEDHEEAMLLFRTYLITGGMPRAALEFRDSGDFNMVLVQQKSISDAYIADIIRNASPADTLKIIAAFDSIPKQLVKSNRKFQYSTIRQGGRASEFETPLDWLRAAGVAFRCVKIKEAKLPLLSYQDAGNFKMYMADTGLLFSRFGIRQEPVRAGLSAGGLYMSALCESFVSAALISAGFTPFYWESSGKAAVEFVIQDRKGNVVPVEVLSSERIKPKNLTQFLLKYDPPYALRISPLNFAKEGIIRYLPLYSCFCL